MGVKFQLWARHRRLSQCVHDIGHLNEMLVSSDILLQLRLTHNSNTEDLTGSDLQLLKTQIYVHKSDDATQLELPLLDLR